MASSPPSLVWIDLEMTGLDLAKDHIMEIACIITDGDLNVVEEGPDLIIHLDKPELDSMNEWCIEHHGKSGLTASCLASTRTLQSVEQEVLAFIKKHIPKANVGVLAGNSVHMDKEFLRKEMPDLLGHLHYRLVDVSTVKELVRRWSPEAYANAPIKLGKHRALDDILESIKELQYYRKSVFKI
ncbi:Oligoribonuclease, mitochondrial [Blyttiomyces sp. JEL0837]|nr:Oligoribonuclease, mitochondrial [Blyttiomyces sp. JEL0837]